MNKEAAVYLDNASESYSVDFVIDGKSIREEILALNRVSLKINKGDCVAVLGANGAGKSTLLKLIGGIFKPDSGEIKVNGRVSSLLDLGAGFDPDLTGRDNIFLLAKLYNVKKEEITQKLKEIIAFSEIGRFIDAPLRCYSSGMYVRLAFSLAIHMDPDILLIDDCLAVGDSSFQNKCLQKIIELKEKSKTIVFVTHDTNLAGMIANRGIFMKDGSVLYDGPIERVFIYYAQMVGDINGIGVLDKSDLAVIFNNGKLYLNFKNTPLCKSFGGFAIAQGLDKQIFSKDLVWNIESKDKDSLVARGSSVDLGLSQVWRLKLDDDISLSWDIESTVSLEDYSLRQINLMLREQFNVWSTLESEGEFPMKFSSLREWQVLESVNANFDRSGLIGACSAGDLPCIMLESKGADCFKSPKAAISGIEQSAKVISLLPSAAAGVRGFSGKIKIFERAQEFQNYLSFRKTRFSQERIIEKGCAKLFFNNNRLHLFYRDLQLTTAEGLSVSFYCGQRWFHSSQAIWEFRKEAPDKASIKLNWPEIRVIQVWQICIVNENNISWKINLDQDKNLDIYTYHTCVFLSDSYQKWFSTYEEGVFPEEFLSQDIILDNKERKSAGVKNNDIYPGLTLDISKESNNSLPVVKNTDSLYKSRVIAACSVFSQEARKESVAEYFSGNINIYPEPELVEQYLALNRKNKLDKEEAGRELRLKANTVQDGEIKISCDSGKIRIFYNHLEVTQSSGIRTIFYVPGLNKELDSDHAKWQVNKISAQRMTCLLYWDELPAMSQKWDIAIKGNVLDLTVTASSYDNMNIYNERMALMLSKKYKEWLTSSGEKGAVDYGFTSQSKGISLRDNKTSALCVKEYRGESSIYPGIIFTYLSDAPNAAAISLHKDYGLGMYFLKVDQREASLNTPGEYLYFKGTITLGQEDLFGSEAGANKHKFNFYKSGPLGVVFDRGTIRLFWKNKEITRGLGIYTSFCSQGHWYDSSQAAWKIKEGCGGILQATGIWPWIPVIQHWDIRAEKKKLILEIDSEVYREFYLDAEEANLYLSDEYTRWFAQKDRGIFYKEFSQGDLFRFRVWVGRISEGRLGVKKRVFRLPQVSLTPAVRDHDAYFAIENANIMGETGRLIQDIKISQDPTRLYKPARYNSFKGSIELK